MTAADGLQICSPSGVTPDVCPLRYRSATKQSSLISFLFLYQVPASADGCWAGLQLLLLWNCEAVRATSREAAAVNRRTVGLILFTWSRLELHNWISQPTFPLFFKSYLCFFSAAAWFSPSISLISSSQPFPVMSSIQQMFFFHVHKETFALTLTFASVSWDGLLLFSSFAAQFWLGTFGLIFLLRDESFAIFLYASGLLTVNTRWLPSCQIQQLHQWP